MGETRLIADGWRQVGTVVARGQAFDRDDQFITPAEAFAGCESVPAVKNTATELTGFFAAIVDGPNAQYLVCDLARSIPLYFRVDSDGVVSDTGTELAPAAPETYDSIAASEFTLTRYVTQGETLAPDVNTVRAGEVVTIPHESPSDFERHRYARYRPTTDVGEQLNTDRSNSGESGGLIDRFDSVMSHVFDRVNRVADDRPVLVPLSGGWDSRLIATELVARDVDVIGFTFGAHGHGDVEVSRDIADALDIRWEWVEYTTDRWHDWYHSNARRDYHEYAFNFDSLPFLAEWPAVYELRSQNRLPEDVLVCPGHTVATPSERIPEAWLSDAVISQSPDAANTVSSEDVVEYILETHYALWDWDDAALRERFAHRIRSAMDYPTVHNGSEAAAAYEQWEWVTRMATFTNADCRLYEWFGFDWWLPLWDPELVEFWASVPLRARYEKQLQREYAQRRLRDVAGADAVIASRTDRDWTPSRQVSRTFETQPERPLIRKITTDDISFEAWLGAQAVPSEAIESWGNYPLRWYGIYPRETEGRFSTAKNLYALRTLAALGRLSFDPPDLAIPIDEELSLPPD